VGDDGRVWDKFWHEAPMMPGYYTAAASLQPFCHMDAGDPKPTLFNLFSRLRCGIAVVNGVGMAIQACAQ
jgi:hypothetical protein